MERVRAGLGIVAPASRRVAQAQAQARCPRAERAWRWVNPVAAPALIWHRRRSAAIPELHMNRIALLTLALAAATASTAALAQSTAAQPMPAQPAAQDAGAHQFHRDHAARGARHGMSRHGRGMEGLARLDANGDGRIARAEIDGKGRMSERLGKDFAAIDANHDGYIVRSELRAYGERMRPQRMAKMQQAFDQRFTGADLNRDGKLSKTEVAEKMPRLAKRFAWMDDNRDGFLSRSELQPVRRR